MRMFYYAPLKIYAYAYNLFANLRTKLCNTGLGNYKILHGAMHAHVCKN